MFERPHHQRIAQVLAALDADMLAHNHCFFGGGTAIALRYGEFRESLDIDFLVSDIDGYRQLRQALTGNQSLGALIRRGSDVAQAAELRADQYGIRSAVRVSDVDIKFEIVLEARIELELPGPHDMLGGVLALTPLDMAAGKLLANSDRWADDSVFSRDLIDLAMMNTGSTLLRRAAEKARKAYGNSIDEDLSKAVDALRVREGRLARCMAVLQMSSIAPAVLWRRIKALRPS